MRGLTALVTGGGSGIGLATARLFAFHGANVVLAGRDAEKLKSAAASCPESEGRVRWLTGDVSSEGHAKKLVSETLHLFGGINILVNNAGVFRGGSILQTEEEDFDYNVAVNLKGTWLMCKYACRPMKEGGGGAIVNVSSFLAIRAHRATPSSAYAAAKGGVLSLTRSLAVELAADKIRVNAVLPAVINTAMLSSLVKPEDVPKLLEKSAQAHPLGRAGESDDVARAIYFLAHPDNSWITGAELNVDGGRSVT